MPYQRVFALLFIVSLLSTTLFLPSPHAPFVEFLFHRLVIFATAGIMVVTVGLSTLCMPPAQQLLLQIIHTVVIIARDRVAYVVIIVGILLVSSVYRLVVRC